MKLITLLTIALFCTATFAEPPAVAGKVTETTFTHGDFTAKVSAEFFEDSYVVKPTDAPAGPAKRMLDLMQRFRQAKTMEELKALYTSNNADWFDKNPKAMQKVLDQNAQPPEKRRMVDFRIFLVVNAQTDQGEVQYVAWGMATQTFDKVRQPLTLYVVRSEDGVDKFDFARTTDPLGSALSKGQWAQFGAPRDVKNAPATKPAK